MDAMPAIFGAVSLSQAEFSWAALLAVVSQSANSDGCGMAKVSETPVAEQNRVARCSGERWTRGRPGEARWLQKALKMDHCVARERNNSSLLSNFYHDNPVKHTPIKATRQYCLKHGKTGQRFAHASALLWQSPSGASAWSCTCG